MLVAAPGQTASYTLATNVSGVGGGSAGGGGAGGTATLSKKSYVSSNIMNKNSTSLTGTSTTNYYPIIATTTTTANTISNINNINKFTIDALQQQQQQKRVLDRDIAIGNQTTTATIKVVPSSSGKSSGTANAKANASDSSNFGRSHTFNENSRNSSSSLVKSLTVRLNRGTETLRATVQKALGAASAVSGIAREPNRSLQEYRNSNNSNTASNISKSWTKTTPTMNAILSTLKFSGRGAGGGASDGSCNNSLIQSTIVPNNNNSGSTSSNKIYNSKSGSMLLSASASASVVIPTNSINNYNLSNNHLNLNISSSKNPSMAFLKLYTVPPTIYHRYPNECIQMSKLSKNSSSNKQTNRSSNIGSGGGGKVNITINNLSSNKNISNNNNNRKRSISTDSLNMEMCHFKPIRSVPTTPWKSIGKSRGCVLRFPKLLKPITRKFHMNIFSCDVKNKQKIEEMKRHHMNKSASHYQHQYNERNSGNNTNDVCENLKPKLSSSTVLLSRLLATANHRSAFVCLLAQMDLWDLDESEDQLDVGAQIMEKAKVNDKKRKKATNGASKKSYANICRTSAPAEMRAAAINEATASTSAVAAAGATTPNRNRRTSQMMPPPPPPPPRSYGTRRKINKKTKEIANVTDVGKFEATEDDDDRSSTFFESTMMEMTKSPSQKLRRSLRTVKSSMTLLKKDNPRKSATPKKIIQSRDSRTGTTNRMSIAKSVGNIVANNKRNSRGNKGSTPPQAVNEIAIKESTKKAAPITSTPRRTASRKSETNVTTKRIGKNNKKLMTPKSATTLHYNKGPAIKKPKVTPKGQQPQPKLKITKSKMINIVKLAQEMRQKAVATTASAAAVAASPPKQRGRKKKQANDASFSVVAQATPYQAKASRKSNNNYSKVNQTVGRKRSLPYDEADENNEATTFPTNAANKNQSLLHKRKRTTAYFPPSILNLTKDKANHDIGKAAGGDKCGSRLSRNYPINQMRASPPLTRGRFKSLTEHGFIVHLNQEVLNRQISGK